MTPAIAFLGEPTALFKFRLKSMHTHTQKWLLVTSTNTTVTTYALEHDHGVRL